MIRIQEIKLALNQAKNEAQEQAELIKKASKLLGQKIISFHIQRKAIDARKKQDVHFVYSVDVVVANEDKALTIKGKSILKVEKKEYSLPKPGKSALKQRPLIVGFGPSGIFAAWVLAKAGYQPIVLERGFDVDTREKEIEHFEQTGDYSEKRSIVFGEGGAGTYSDGKLTTLINDPRCEAILDVFATHGAHSSVRYLAKPHIGTDELTKVIKNIRNDLIKMGASIRFGAKVTKIRFKNGKISSLIINGEEELTTDVCLIGIGHSARDTFEMLYQNDLNMVPKAFSIGLRIEHLQSMINERQYGKFATHKALGAADYKLSYHSPSGRSAYTFCMCPGGYVVCSTSEEKRVVTNGMSKHKRDGLNANSALLVNVLPSDFPSDHPLAGIEFQRQLEEKAFQAGGGKYYAPIQRVGDFLQGRVSTEFGSVKPTYRPGVKFAELGSLLPIYVRDTLKEALIDFDQKIPGFASSDALLTGIETRSSSPVRMLRSDEHESNIGGLYVMGEGAGHAGGIMSSAVDGMKTAEMVITKYHYKP